MAPEPTRRRQRFHVPGPGSFDVPSTFGGSSSSRHPGSGIVQSPAYSIPSGRYEGPGRDETTGPGSYPITSLDVTRKKAKGVAWSRSPRFGPAPSKEKVKEMKNRPGAELAHAEAGTEVNHRFARTPNYSFGTSQRPNISGGADQEETAIRKPWTTLGPGQYEPTEDFQSGNRKGPTFSFQGRREEGPADMPTAFISPGPGHYTAPLVRKQGDTRMDGAPQTSRSFRFGIAKRECGTAVKSNKEQLKEQGAQTPGPGHYATKSDFAGDGIKWSMSPRPDLEFGHFNSPVQGWV